MILTESINDSVVASYGSGNSAAAVSRLLNMSRGSVLNILHRNNVKIRPAPHYILTDEEKDAIVQEYTSGSTTAALGSKYGVCQPAIWYLLNRRKVLMRPGVHLTSRKYALNHSFFRSPLVSQEQAYLLGFTAADGGIYRGTLVYNLAERDFDHLEKIRSALQSGLPIRRKKNNAFGLQIASKALVADLAILGIGERKSFTCPFWSGPPELMPHYLRGLIDGDGCWSCSRGTWSLMLCGSEQVVRSFSAYICRYFPGHSPVITDRNRLFLVRFGDLYRLKAIAEYLYGNATFYLDRKKLLIDKLLSTDYKRPGYRFRTNKQ